MKLIFKTSGRYKSDMNTVVVTPEEVEKKIPVEIFEVNAIRFIDADRAERFVPKPAPAPEPPTPPEIKLSDLKLEELVTLAKEKKIPLREAKLKKDVLPIIEEFLKKSESTT